MVGIQVVSLRIVREKRVPYRKKTLTSSQDVFALFQGILADYDREAFWVACCDSKGQICCVSPIAVGSLSTTPIHPREVFKVALIANAHSVIFAHNHPSGDPSPSAEDFETTFRLQVAACLLGIDFRDHLIVGDGEYFSFADQGLLSSIDPEFCQEACADQLHAITPRANA